MPKNWVGREREGMGFSVGWGCSFCFRARARVWSCGVFRFGVSGLRVQGKGFPENVSGFRDE